MAAITTLTENFEGGAQAAPILTSNTIFDTESGTGADSIFATPAHEATLAMYTAPGTVGARIYRVDITAVTTLWFGCYFRVNALPAVATAIIAFYGGTTKIADVRTLVDGTIQMRSVNTDRFTSTAVTLGTWHRMAVQVAPTVGGTGTLRMRLYEDASRNSVTPTQDSLAQTASALVGTVDNVRVGALSGDATLGWMLDRVRGDDATEPAGTPGTNNPPVANAGPNQTVAPSDLVTLSGAGSTDSDGTVTGHAWTQTGGPTVTLSGSGTGSRTFTAPATETVLTFSLVVTDDLAATSTPDTMTVTVVDTTNGDITALTENWETGTNGADITTANSGADNISGAGTAATFVNTPHEGVLAARHAPGAGGPRIHRYDFTASATLWVGFYFQVVTNPTGTIAILAAYSGTGATEVKVGDVRVLPSGAIQLRAVNTDRYTSPALAAGWYRASVRLSPTVDGTGVCRLRIYTGDQTIPTHDSGDQALAALVGTVDNIRIGSITLDATLVVLMDRMRGNSVSEPAGVGGANNPPTAFAEPVGIAALLEDFNGGAAGTAITLSPATIFDSETGAGAASTFSTDTGRPAMRNAPGGTDFRVYRADFTAVPDLWQSFYFTLDAVPTASVAVFAFYSGTTKIGDMQVIAGTSELRLRSVSTTRWTSVAVAVGVKHRLMFRIAPTVAGNGVLRLQVHEGTSRDSATPTQDSGDQVSSATVASVDNTRTGSLTADATLVWRASRLRASTSPPRAALEPFTTFTLQGSGSDPDPGSSIVDHTWVQLSVVGPAPVGSGVVPLVGSGTGPRTGVVPAEMFGAELVYGLTVTDDQGAVSPQDTVQVTALPHNRWANVNGVRMALRRYIQ